MNNIIRVAIADDDAIFRSSLYEVLAAREDIELVGTASDGLRLLKLLETRPVDVALLDVDMPWLNGIRTAELITERYPKTAVAMLTAFRDENSLSQALQHNVRGFFTKDLSGEDIAANIRKVAAGETVLGNRPSQIMVQHFVKTSSRKRDPGLTDAVNNLPRHLRSVFDLLVQGLPNKAIAQKLHLSDSTVRSYVSALFDATGYRTRGELMMAAIDAGDGLRQANTQRLQS